MKTKMIFLFTVIWLLNPLSYTFAKEIQLPESLPHLYFAYGSNLSYEFLKERLKNGQWIDNWHKDGELEGPPPLDLGFYELSDYEFSYSLNAEAFGDEGTAGNIVPKEGAKVCGILYCLSDAHLAELDKTEDVPEAYVRVAVKVAKAATNLLQDSFLESMTAWVYVGNPKYVVQEENPDPIYVALLVQAALERSFPSEYIEKYLYKGDYKAAM